MIVGFSLVLCVGCWIALFDLQRRFKQEQGRRIVAELDAQNLLRAALGTEPYFACPECRAVSYSLADVEHGWCGRCRRETGKPSRMGNTE